jgi:hypothetical protein
MFRTLSFAALSAVALADGTWGPADSAHALDGVIGAVEKIVHLPNLSAKQLEEAKKIAADIKGDVEAVEGGKLTKEQAHEKVGEGLKELAAFSSTLQGSHSASERRAELQQRLSEKEAVLAKLQKQMEVLKLKKELVEKKLQLQKLLEAKAGSSKHSDAEDGKAMAALTEQLHRVAGDIKGAEAAKALQAVQQREEAVKARLTQLEADEAKSEAMMKTAVEGQLQNGGSQSDDALQKGRIMIRELEKREKRKFAKVRAGQQLELEGLKEAEASLKSHDTATLQKSLQKLEQENKASQAKSGKFLY